MLKEPDRMHDFVELVAKLVANECGGNRAIWANCILWCNRMEDWFTWQFVIANVLTRDTVRLGRLTGCRRLFALAGLVWCSLRIMLLGFRAEVFAIALLELDDENIELLLQILELISEIFVAGERLGELLAKFGAAAIRLSELRFERCQRFVELDVLLSQAIDFGFT
jgi:hypothetical protein